MGTALCLTGVSRSGCGGSLAGSYGEDRRLFSLALFFLALQVSLASVVQNHLSQQKGIVLRNLEAEGPVGLMRASTLVGTSGTRPLYPQKEGKCWTSVPVPTPSKPLGGSGSHKVWVNPTGKHTTECGVGKSSVSWSYELAREGVLNRVMATAVFHVGIEVKK